MKESAMECYSRARLLAASFALGIDTGGKALQAAVEFQAKTQVASAEELSMLSETIHRDLARSLSTSLESRREVFDAFLMRLLGMARSGLAPQSAAID